MHEGGEARLRAMRRPSLPKPKLPKLPKLLSRSKKPLTPQQAALKPQTAAAPSKPGLKTKLAGKLPAKRPPLKLILPAAGAILVVVLLIGTCGTDEDKRVRDTLSSFAEASREKDYQALCDDLLSSRLVDQLRTADQPCEVVLRIGLSEVQNPTLEVLSVTVDGDEATAQVDTAAAGQPPLKTSILLVREDGDWRISSLPDEQRSAATP